MPPVIATMSTTNGTGSSRLIADAIDAEVGADVEDVRGRHQGHGDDEHPPRVALLDQRGETAAVREAEARRRLLDGGGERQREERRPQEPEPERRSDL